MNTQDTPISTSKPPPCAPSGTQTCAAEKDTEPSIVAVEEDAESLLLGWDAVEGAVFYELQMLKQAVKSIGGEEDSQAEDWNAARAMEEPGLTDHGDAVGEWCTLSASLKSNMVRKRNLSHSTPYRFRVRVRDKVDWLPFQTSSLLHTLSTFVQRMAAPRGEVGGAAGCVTLSWEPVEEAAAYAVHMREQGAVRWKEVGRVGGTSVKKKNLEAGKAYHFRVRPVGERVEDVWVWSPWSEAMSPPSLPPVLRRMFGSRLAVEVGKEGKKEIGVESLAGSVVGVYASAHWCAPCRQFTPQLANFYRGLQGAGKAFEIVFVSLDQEKEAFELYFESMPWLAIPWEGGEGEREALMRMYQITSVPRLLIFGRDGELLENNAVGSQFLREEAFHSWWEGRPFRAGGGGCCGGGGCK
ncbi:tsa family domain-containing protein [Nannochloropsis gaditana CCMP526]|uniref:tsa family domain-containing protein n=1 Tax=Nannochloropsis gaditana (strain CCMP526) TaxID=1093141 RepID=UPI00029F4F9E|nr:tsa family domain-containing protein [Nannochloropsis gaditana CCMP526]EKU21455.1 tsa family domain-containing protein [Nannochloropsis gaditana CCMP526]|eukprot:XP_005854911.1 tsa family domain-containing protein [Nannochloropsis gaditana CCMP526]